MSRLILVSNRLPLRIDGSGAMTRTTGGLASALAGAATQQETLWIGWPGVTAEHIADIDSACRNLAQAGLRPVFLDSGEIEEYYDGYGNATLWPLLHYLSGRARFSEAWAAGYLAVNRRFAEVVLEEAGDGDLVWIHDYHLFPLATMLREGRPSLRIGFFLHTPFPSSDVLRILPEREQILTGLLGADLIGFHTYNYLRHFRSAILRVLGIESEPDSLRYGGRTVRLRVFPIGHDHRGFAGCMRSDDFRIALEHHAAGLKDRRLIVSVGRLDYTKGVPQKIAAIRRFLADHPDRRDRVAFVLIAVPSRRGVEEYDDLTEEVQRAVGSINGDFGSVGHSPLRFLHRSLSMVELAALYALADVCLVTPLIDGMNLVAKEFIDCQRPELTGIGPGVLVLSEFAGAANELSQALLVNPYDEAAVVRAISEALAMPECDRQRRVDAMQPRLVENDAAAWADRFVRHLDIPPVVQRGVALAALEPLVDRIADCLAAGEKAALFLDYDGTLRPFTAAPDDAIPDPYLLERLTRICSAPGIDVAVVSGRTPEFLERHLGTIGAALVCEHGAGWRMPGSANWKPLTDSIDTFWKEVIRRPLEQAARDTPGSQLEDKATSLVWHYRRADPEFGPWRAHALLSELTEMAANLPVTVHHGHGIVEVSSLLVSKGAAVERLLAQWRPAVALVAGDDQTDETMFALERQDCELLTVKIGDGPTRAHRRTDIAGLRRLIELLYGRVVS